MVSHHSDVYCSGTAVAVSEGSVAVVVCKQETAIEVTKGVLATAAPLQWPLPWYRGRYSGAPYRGGLLHIIRVPNFRHFSNR